MNGRIAGVLPPLNAGGEPKRTLLVDVPAGEIPGGRDLAGCRVALRLIRGQERPDPTAEGRRPFTLYLDHDTLDALVEFVATEGVPPSEWVEGLIRERLGVVAEGGGS